MTDEQASANGRPQLQFLGAARTTTGSMHLLTAAGKRVLLDCGLYQGRRKEAFERNRKLACDPLELDACVLSHAHIDHSGNLPSLVKQGFKGPIYSTPATRDLCEIMLLDSAHIQTKDVEFVNRKRKHRGQKPFEPLYETADVKRTLELFETVPYGQEVMLADGLGFAFHDAGHLLGSALTRFQFPVDGETRRLLYTGDLGRHEIPILGDPRPVRDIDYLVTESTYGNREHPPEADVKAKLLTFLEKIVAKRSRLVIPAFSVGRTQHVLFYLHQLWQEKKLGKVPVYVDSPLSTRATKVYEKHPEGQDPAVTALFRQRDDPYSFGGVTFTTKLEESMRLNRERGPLVIISASGMCEAGRILHHLKHSIEDPDNIVLIVGFQAEHTLGRRLIERQQPIRIFGEEYRLRAEVHSIQALSAHADRNELLEYYQRTGLPERRAFVVHGEPDQSEPLAEALRGLGVKDVVVPAPGQKETL